MKIKPAIILLAAALLTAGLTACGGKGARSASGTVSSGTAPPTLSSSQVSAEPVMQIVSDEKYSTYEKLTVNSKVLGKAMRINVHLPPDYDRNGHYPVIYLFHGVDANEDAWFPYMGLEKTADQLIADKKIRPVILVAPQIDNSFGINSADTCASQMVGNHRIDMGRYEDYICQELIPFIDGEYGTIQNRADRYIGGFSMGGFIALHTAFLHGDLFSRVCGDSPAVWTNDNITDYAKVLLYPTATLQAQRDPLSLAKPVTAENGLTIRLNCGSEDELRLYEGTTALYNTLKANGVSVSCTISAGKHDFSYWSAQITDDLLFYAGT